MQKIQVMNIAEAEAHEPGPDQVCISVTSPTIRADLHDGWRAVLRLVFSDIDKTMYPEDADLAGFDKLFTPEMARKIVRFARKHSDATLVVHCEAGISRSPAIALALHEILSGEKPPPIAERRASSHNRFVRRLVLEAGAEEDA